RPDRRLVRRLASALPDAVHGYVGVVGKGEHVGVAGELLTQPVRHGQASGARAQQNLRRPDRAGGQHDDVGGDVLARGAPVATATLVGVVVDRPPGLGPGRHVVDGALGEDLRPVVDGVGEVVHQHGVLGAVVAPAHAVAAVGARRL